MTLIFDLLFVKIKRKKICIEELLYLIRRVSFVLLSIFLFRLFTTQEDIIIETRKKERIVCY